jgi:pimeloyl-ACP methyl ester carboxylesterase
MRKLCSAIVVLVLSFCVGCQIDSLAKQRIYPANTGAGKLALIMAGTGEQLVKRGRIDLHRRVTIPDKTIIDVWVLRAWRGAKDESPKASLGTVVLLHGMTESKASFPYLGTGQRLAKMGYDVVLPDLRWHGRSTGHCVTYGAKERSDVKAVIDTLVGERRISPVVYAFGVNLGGATAIQYAAIDERCRGVMAIAPYKDFVSIARQSMLLLSDEDFRAVVKRTGELGNFDPENASAIKAATQLKCPLLVVHGLLDMSVPREHSQAIVDAAPEPKELIGPDLARTLMTEDWIASNIDKLAKTGLRK